ncbi:MAG TPA: hypothetical protein VG410_09805 [Solirubrobacteraceae bacterium]|jgi:hypothetical protein|nr:hypothetical protein [Solirubrobacteraceae bacterium]
MRRTITVIATAVVTMLAAAPALAGSPAEHAVADFMSGPFHVQFTASRAANAPADAATGTFVARAAIGSVGLTTLEGPVTCLDIRGVHLGLFYPVTSSDPSFLGKAIHGVYIYVTDNLAGKAESVNFLPTSARTASTCPPVPGIFPITSGTATFSP